MMGRSGMCSAAGAGISVLPQGGNRRSGGAVPGPYAQSFLQCLMLSRLRQWGTL